MELFARTIGCEGVDDRTIFPLSFSLAAVMIAGVGSALAHALGPEKGAALSLLVDDDEDPDLEIFPDTPPLCFETISRTRYEDARVGFDAADLLDIFHPVQFLLVDLPQLAARASVNRAGSRILGRGGPGSWRGTEVSIPGFRPDRVVLALEVTALATGLAQLLNDHRGLVLPALDGPSSGWPRLVWDEGQHRGHPLPSFAFLARPKGPVELLLCHNGLHALVRNFALLRDVNTAALHMRVPLPKLLGCFALSTALQAGVLRVAAALGAHQLAGGAYYGASSILGGAAGLLLEFTEDDGLDSPGDAPPARVPSLDRVLLDDTNRRFVQRLGRLMEENAACFANATTALELETAIRQHHELLELEALLRKRIQSAKRVTEQNRREGRALLNQTIARIAVEHIVMLACERTRGGAAVFTRGNAHRILALGGVLGGVGAGKAIKEIRAMMKRTVTVHVHVT